MLVNIIFPIITGKLIASFTANFNANTTLKYALLILVVEVSYLPISYIIDLLWNKCHIYVKYDMGMNTINRVNNIKIICFDNNNTSKFTSRMFNDISTIATFPLNIMNYLPRKVQYNIKNFY